MKKILGLVAMALLLGGPAFAATNTSVVNYTLEVGGNNHADLYEGGQTPQFTGGQTTLLTLGSGVDVVTWAVKVDVGGLVDVAGVDVPVLGAANVVWTLELYKPDGTLVAAGAAPLACQSGTIAGGDCLNAQPTAAGFFSTINDGDKDGSRGSLSGADAQQLAAFAFGWSVSGSAPYARVFDLSADNGPELKRKQYPSAGGTPPFPAGSTAPAGKLVGMGAGYESFVGTFGGGTMTAGVGVTDTAQCAYLGTGPVAEGQISLKGLTDSGTYTLKIVPGQGNNVLAVDACNTFAGGRFAVAANSVTTSNGGQVQFVYTAVPTTGTLAVALQTNGAPGGPAGSAWSIDAGANWHTEASLSVNAGTYTVSFQAASGYITPAAQPGVVVTAGATTNVTGNYIAMPPPPAVTAAATTRTHGNGVGPCQIALNLTAGANTAVEPRTGGPQLIEVTYAAPIAGTPAVTVSAGTVGTPTIAGTLLSIPLSAVPDKTCVTITINGITAVGSTLTATNTLKVLALRGDCSGDHVVGATDMAQIKARTSSTPILPANAKYDVSCDGLVGATDMAQVKASTASTNWPCTN